MKVEKNTTIYMGDFLQGADADSRAGRRNGGKTGNSGIFGGTLNLNQIDPIEFRKRQARQQAMKVVTDAFSGEQKLDNDKKDRDVRTKELLTLVKEDRKAVKELEGEKEALRQEMGIDKDSKEQQGLELLERIHDARRVGTSYDMSEEEQALFKDISGNGMTEYQKRAMEIYGKEDPFRSEIEDSMQEMKDLTAITRAVELERLKSSPMLEASKEKDDILAAASQEIIGMLLEEAKDHIDETMEEQQEKAEEKEEKEEEKEEQLEEVKKENAEEEARVEEIRQKNAKTEAEAAAASAKAEEAREKSKGTEDGDTLDMGDMKEITDYSEHKTDIESEIQNILSKAKLIEEDIKGAKVDTKS